MAGRTSKQCRERYVNYLDPQLNLGEWTRDEDLRLVAMRSDHKMGWADIGRALNGRAANVVKNRFGLLQRKHDDGSAERQRGSRRPAHVAAGDLWPALAASAGADR
ncbi:unnamed protein product, partial [Phaeothamnion confervicola]